MPRKDVQKNTQGKQTSKSKPKSEKSNNQTKQKSKSFSKDKKQLNKNSSQILNKKQKRLPESNSSDDSSDEEVLVRTGDVPENWYDGMEHVGYDINSNKVLKNPEEDEIEKFIKKANDKNWWREIYDSKNNSSVYLSDKDLEIINRIRQGKMANKKVGEDDYFEDDLPYQIHPMSNQIPSKKKFGFSRNEQKTINRLVYLYKNGLMPMEKPKKTEQKIYDIWEFEDENDLSQYRPGFGFQIPKRELPDNEESYNTKENKDGGILRRIPRYDNLIEEELERCCDLFLSARTIRKKLDLKENDVLPDLPKPEELRPFPTKECMVYKGHESSIRDICCDPNGNVLISADNGNLVFFWDILTGKIITKFDLKEKVRKININKFLKLIVICTETHIFFILPRYLEKKYKEEILTLVKEKIYPKIIENKNTKEEEKESNKDNNNITINDSFVWHIPKSDSKKEKQGILFYMKWTQGVIKNLVWHNKGDYFGTLSKNSQGKTQVYIHSLTKMTHQLPISHIKGNANCISFHPNKPYFIVATNSNIFVYNLQKQELSRKFISNLNTINRISIHKNGNDLIAGDKSGKVAWFQLELSSKPFKLMDYHQDKIKSVEFNNNFPLFLSCSRNGKLVVYYGKVNDEELVDPLIVPLKVLKVNNNSENNKGNNNMFTCACFHPNQIWIFSGGEDGKIRMWC
jgi:ribosome biogenesis protein ERB1